MYEFVGGVVVGAILATWLAFKLAPRKEIGGSERVDVKQNDHPAVEVQQEYSRGNVQEDDDDDVTVVFSTRASAKSFEKKLHRNGLCRGMVDAQCYKIQDLLS